MAGILDGLLGMFGGQQQPQGGLLGTGGSNSLYGDLLTPQQQQALQQRASQGGLLALANSGALNYEAPFLSGRVPGGFAKGVAAYAGGMGEGEDKGILNALNAQLVGLKGQDLKSQLAIRRSMLDDLDKLVSGGGGPGPNTGGPPITPPGGGLLSGPAGGGEAVSSNTASLTLPAEARALLDSISGPESSGSYNSRWPSKTFADYSDHPRIFEPGPEGPSSAAGRYQIVASTWDPVAQKLGLKDFKPESQDTAAWDLAQTEYNRKTGGDLLADLKAGKTDRVADALAGQWATLRRGISAYPQNLAKYMQAGPLQLAGDSDAGGTGAQPRSLADLANVVANLQPRQPQGGLLGYGGTDYPASPGSPADKQSAADALVRTPHPELSAAFAKARNAGFNGTIEDFVRQATGQQQQGLLAQGGPQDTAGTSPMPAAPRPVPQGSLLSPPAPQAVSPITMPQPAPQPATGVGASPRVGGIDPLALARLGVKAELGGLGDVFKPLSSYYYQSPEYLQRAEGAKEGGKRSAGYPYDIATETHKGDIALRNERSKFMDVPGVGVVDLSQLGNRGGGGPQTADAGSPGQPGVAVPRMTDAQRLTLEGGLATTKDRLKEYHDEGRSAVEQVSNAASITDLLGRVRMGWNANTVQQGARILSSLGVPTDTVKQFLGTDPAAGDSLNKLFLKFSADAVRQMGAREPGSVISLFSKAFPNLETHPQAAELMTNALRMNAQWKQDRANAAEQWAAGQQQSMGRFGENYKGMLGFEGAFAQERNPRDYWRAAAAMSSEPDIAWHGASAEEKQRIYDLIPGGTPFRAGDGKLYAKPRQ